MDLAIRNSKTTVQYKKYTRTFVQTLGLMESFNEFNLSTPLKNAIGDLGFSKPTPIQEQAFSVIRSGKDVVGIAQTGTGKTLAYLLPIINDLKFSKQLPARVLIMVPTRELVLQVVEEVEKLTQYINLRVKGVYGGVNMKTQAQTLLDGIDILVATPGRLYDLTISQFISLKSISKLVIDEVDEMLDLGFRFQLTNIFDLLPEKRQNIMFSATMTDEVSELIEDFFLLPERISIAVSGTRLNNIQQSCYQARNFLTKVNLLNELLRDTERFKKVLIFISNKKLADRLYEELLEYRGNEIRVIHSNKTQNHRIQSVEDFEEGKNRILIATDLMSRGLDIKDISHVINFDTPNFPENYMHRIGRTGRAEQEGHSILFYTEKEIEWKEAIENLMNYQIPEIDFPEDVEEVPQLIPEEKPKTKELNASRTKNVDKDALPPGFHEKKDKNKKVNLGGSYKRIIAEKYKKPQTKGDKFANKGKKKKR